MGLRDRIVADRTRGQDGSPDGVGYYRHRLLEEIDLNEIAVLSEEQKRARLERVVGRMVSREGPVLTTAERARLIRRVVDEAVGLGVLLDLAVVVGVGPGDRAVEVAHGRRVCAITPPRWGHLTRAPCPPP